MSRAKEPAHPPGLRRLVTALGEALGGPDAAWRRRLRRLRRPALLAPFRTRPASDYWGIDRGTPVDRYFIERFLAEHRADIRGRVLEVQDTRYAARFGSGVDRVDVLDLNPANPLATIVGDLTVPGSVPADAFDCFVLTQTLQFIYDVRAAVAQAHRLLKPGGVLLATVPSVSRLAPVYGLEGDYWRFTPASCAALFGEAFGPGAVSVRGYGNPRAAIAFLAGLAQEELPRRALEAQDDHFPVIVAARAVKRGGEARG
ncbi:MAG TPA: methyltransferase domain-containing protein [Gemmatimonadales bacterium]|nr:methyltransferase domain-containing protein [Gemmatimonadales bacterium]